MLALLSTISFVRCPRLERGQFVVSLRDTTFACFNHRHYDLFTSEIADLIEFGAYFKPFFQIKVNNAAFSPSFFETVWPKSGKFLQVYRSHVPL